MNKKILMAILILVCLVPVLVFAQDNETTIQKGNKTIIIKKTQQDLGDLEELKKLNINVEMSQGAEESADAPFFGIYPADLDFPKAQALNYPNSYGVLITGIVPESPAYKYRLAEDDIIMEINGKKALNLKEFDKQKALYRAGDAVNLTVFRMGEVKSIDFVFGSKATKSMPTSIEVIKKKQQLSPGSGGGTWIPMWYEADLKDVNELITAIGFSKLPEDGILTQGFGGKGNVGSGWMLGGQFQFYSDTKKVREIDSEYINSMDYNLFIGAATLDKRIPITKNIVTSMGVMIGGASHTIELVHSNGDYNWPDGTSPGTGYIMNANSYAKISKGYILVQPRAELMVRLLSWLAIRGEVGYLYGYGPTSGWKVKHNNTETYELKNSPDTPFEGLTFTVGPWFGF
jgi:hypothetical protein